MSRIVALLSLSALTMRAVSGDPPAAERADLIVALDGTGSYATIQAAIDASSPDSVHPVIILIRRGMYHEKLFIRKSYLSLVGEDRAMTRIVYPELREEWNRTHGGSDWGAGVVNIDTEATDVTLANLTVYNNHGSLYGSYNKHQFAIRGFGTRIVLLSCNVISDGGDALSLWNRQNGMYYHSGCSFEGWVDFVCPRGWCYITDSRFFGHNTPSASIWHDGSTDRTQKFVIANSSFDGVAGFPLGRNHLDAQIYLLNCTFSANMADKPFIRPPSSPREWAWGDRHYFFNCHRTGGDFSWFRDNLSSAQGSPDAGTIDARWTFDGRWDPEAAMKPLLPGASMPVPRPRAQAVAADGAVLSWLPGRNAASHRIYFGTSDRPEYLRDQAGSRFGPGGLAPKTTYYWRVDEVTADSTIAGDLWSFTTR